MSLADVVTVALASLGLVFFIAGAVGLLRFRDVHSRLHALTKADTLGLGLIAIGLVFQADHLWLALKVILIWLLAMLAAATVAQLIARVALSGSQPTIAGSDDDGAGA